MHRTNLLGETMHISETIGPLRECAVCLGVHDPDLHAATVTLHLWLRREIARRIQPEPFVILDNYVPALAARV